jgi:hypothetical protein
MWVVALSNRSFPPPPEVIGSADLLVRDLLHLTLEAIEALSRPT